MIIDSTAAASMVAIRRSTMIVILFLVGACGWENVIRDPMDKRDSGVRRKDLITIAFDSYTKKYVLFLPCRDFITVVTCDFKQMRKPYQKMRWS